MPHSSAVTGIAENNIQVYMYGNHTLLNLAEIKVLSSFLDLKRHYFAELTRVTKLSRPRTLRVLRKLVKQGILEVNKEANVKYYSLKKTPLVFTTLGIVEYNKTLLFLSKNKTLTRALGMFKEKYSDYSIMLVFGSVVKGYATSKSDVDLLLIKENILKSDVRLAENITDLINGRSGLRLSPYLMTMGEFGKINELAKQAVESHVLIDGAELFFRIVLR